MKRLFILLIILSSISQAYSQFVYKIKADSVLITNDSCTAELNLENSTKHIKGFLYNKGNGRTEFRKAVVLNDSAFVFGQDTLVIRGSGKNAWKLTGNAGTDTATNFIGTTDAQALVVRTNNKPMITVSKYDAGLYNGGGIGMGTVKPVSGYKLHINAHNHIDPSPALFPGITGGLVCADEGTTAILNITAGADFDRPFFVAVKANGTLTNPTSVTSNSRIGGLSGWAFDGTRAVGSGNVNWWVDGPVSTGNVPSQLILSTSTAGVVTEKMAIKSSGNVGIGTTSPATKLHVIGNALFSGGIVTRVSSTTSSSTITPNALTDDVYAITALAENTTIAAPSGTFNDGQIIVLRIKDNGTSRTIAWNSIYRGGTNFSLPTSTEAGKTMYITFIWNAQDSKLDAVGLSRGY